MKTNQTQPKLANMLTVTEPFEVLDCLAGSLSGNYEKDKKKVEKTYNKTFTEKTYQSALMINENP